MKKLCATLGFTLAAAGLTAHAADPTSNWPSKPITYVAAFPAGSNTDLLARIISQKLSVALKVPVIVDNKPGAGGMIASTYVSRAPADGYTILGASISTHSINPSLYRNMQYDAVKSFSPITVLGTNPNVLVVPVNSPYKSIRDIIDAAKAKPGTLAFASSGIGTTQHLCGELLQKMTGIKLIHAPYAKSPPIQDVIGGQIPMMFEGPSVQSHIKNGNVRALAVTSTKRLASLPDVPTVAESGIPGYEVRAWQALFAPAGTPAPIVDRLHQEVAKILKMPDVVARFEQIGVEPSGITPKEFAAFQQSEIEKWKKVVEFANVRLD